MLPVQVALVSQSSQTDPADVSHVAAALSKQAARDVAPLWTLTATVDAFPSLRKVPVGYWPVSTPRARSSPFMAKSATPAVSLRPRRSSGQQPGHLPANRLRAVVSAG